MIEVIPARIGGQLVLLLKEGGSRATGRDALRSNIMAARAVSEIVRSSLGPKGMDKMLVDSLGDITITNDGVTIVDEMEVQHPAAKMMVEIAKATDKEVGDGTTSAVVIAGELLKNAEELIDKGVHPTVVLEGYRKASSKTIEILNEVAKSVSPGDEKILRQIALTSISSKLVSTDGDFLAGLAVRAVMRVAERAGDRYRIDLDDVKIEKKAGQSFADTKLIEGIALDKEVVHAGMPKRVENGKIAILNCALEIEKTEVEAKITIKDPSQMQAFLDEEQRMIKEMVDKIRSVGADVVITQKGIDDLAQHFLTKAGILAVRRVKESDMDKLAKATGGKLVVNLKGLVSSDLGEAKLVEERKVGEDKWTFVEGCKNPKSVTILVRGGTEKIVQEAERSVRDAIYAVRDVLLKPKITAGGGSVEVETALRLNEWTESLTGRDQLAAKAFASSLEVIPATLAENGGLDPIDILVQLKAAHEGGDGWAGVDLTDGKIKDMMQRNIIEPLSVKEQIIKSATEAAALVLKVDDVVVSSKAAESLFGKESK